MKKDRRAAMALYQSDSSHSSSLTIPFLQMLYTIAFLLKSSVLSYSLYSRKFKYRGASHKVTWIWLTTLDK